MNWVTNMYVGKKISESKNQKGFILSHS